MTPKPTRPNEEFTSELMRHQKVGVFVDAQNMYHSAKNLYKARVDFGQILQIAVDNRQLIRAFAYAIKTESGEEKAFLEALKKAGFELKVKDLQIFPGGMKKGDWDVGIAIDAVILADKIDVAVLVEGDGDFVPLVDYLKTNKGVKVEVVSFGRSTSAKLIEAANKFVDLDEIADSVILRTRKN
ncbi:MAG: NYN domain-containing protein [Candidatus Taylorbacteria bacterium]|nr:NYN domain-containing protein [Candidatus Taylorbacteria bacterium]